MDPMSSQFGQTLADVATIGLPQQRDIDSAGVLTGQLQTALASLVVIEQAQGMRAALTPEKAIHALRAYAHHLRLSDQ